MSEDPRQTRTREALGAALVRLLATEPLSRVSVASLCREAGVHRTTFYGHADGVESFAISWFTRDLDELSAVAPVSDTPRDVAGEYLRALQDILGRIAADRSIFRAMFAPSTRGAFRAALEERFRSRAALALQVLDAHGTAGLPESAQAREEAAAFIAGALVGVVEVWTREDDDDAGAASRRVLSLMPRWWPLRG